MRGNMVRRLIFYLAMCALPVLADTRGSVRGRVSDPTGAMIPGAALTLTDLAGGRTFNAITDQQGQYQFDFVEAGPYRVNVNANGFRSAGQDTTVISGQRVELNFRLELSNTAITEITVTESAEQIELRSNSIQSTLTTTDITHLAGASESIAGIEARTNTAWRSQEHLHIRGGHQVGYQVNGIAIPDLSLFGTLTPVIDPRNLKFAEVTSGGLLPEFGNRTAGVINAITRSGFDAGEHGSIETSTGNLGRESLFANFGDHISDRFAYYIQGTALASGRGMNPPPDSLTESAILDRPVRQDRHNFRRTYQNFGNFEWRPTTEDSLNLVVGGFRSDFQIPNTVGQQLGGRDYVQFERDHFENIRWLRALSADRLLNVSLYHHFNRLEIDGHVDEPDLPLAGDNRRANYFGGLTEFSAHAGHHLFKAGYGVYAARLRDDFSIGATLSHVPVHSWEHSAYFQDQFDATDRLTLNYGGRLDAFSVNYLLRSSPQIHRQENFMSPRSGFAYRIDDHQTVIFGNAGYMFLPPPLEYFEGVRFTPVRPEKDVQYDVGVRFLVKGYRIRLNRWYKHQHFFLDHVQLSQLNGNGKLINPNIFLPVNLHHARTHGVEAFIEGPAHRGLHTYLNYSFGYAQGFGGIVHGFDDRNTAAANYFFLDHDQRHQLYIGADYQFERSHAFINGNYAFGSGFPDASNGLFGKCVAASCRLPHHSTVNLTLGKSLTRSIDARLEIENLTNHVYPINLGSEFNGSHVSIPRLVSVRLAYHF
jgi:outer membrane receptor protein involved in Fe transport